MDDSREEYGNPIGIPRKGIMCDCDCCVPILDECSLHHNQYLGVEVDDWLNHSTMTHKYVIVGGKTAQKRVHRLVVKVNLTEDRLALLKGCFKIKANDL